MDRLRPVALGLAVVLGGAFLFWMRGLSPQASGILLLCVAIVYAGARWLDSVTRPRYQHKVTALQADVWVAIAALTDPDNVDPGDAVDAMTSRGLSRIEAERLLAFVPIAFGRVVLEDLGFNDLPKTFVIKSRGGDMLVQKLRGDPYYREAKHIGFHMLTEWDHHTMLQVAGQSPEVQFVNTFHNEDQSIEDLTRSLLFAEPALVRLTAEEWLAESATRGSR